MEDLQSILEKINRDGVEKAEAEAARIIGEAKANAARIVSDAQEQATKTRTEAERDAAAFVTRANETISQAARDTLLTVERGVSALLEKLLTQGVQRALNDEATVTKLAESALTGLVGPGEIACGTELAKALAAALAGKASFTVVTDETAGAGFTVKTEDGRVEHDFTGKTLAAELAKRLRPELAKLVK